MGRRKTLPGEVVESFYGVYLLVCANPRYKGRTYIGFTVDPNRRIQQHNQGKEKGGAWRTSNRGPWNMVLIVHGFPNEISALRFEWAWQHPQRSRRLRHVSSKKSKESAYEFALRVLSEMMRVGPWNRLPLTLRWLLPDFAQQFPPDRSSPIHMAVCYGPVVSKKLPKKKSTSESEDHQEVDDSLVCCLCAETLLPDQVMTCLVPSCSLRAHIICLAKKFLEGDSCHVVPVEGSCPECQTNLLWGELIRKKKGCYANLAQEEDEAGLSDYETELN